MSIADAAKELRSFGLIQTDTNNAPAAALPTELGGAGAKASGPKELGGNDSKETFLAPE